MGGNRFAWLGSSAIAVMAAFLLGLYVALIMASVGPIVGSYGPGAMLWGILAAFLMLIVGVLLLKRLGRNDDADPEHAEFDITLAV